MDDFVEYRTIIHEIDLGTTEYQAGKIDVFPEIGRERTTL
jgi:hypothetical protein